MAYQPVVRLADGDFRAYEALARFDHPELRNPALAFAAAARAGLGTQLELLAVRKAFEELDERRPVGAGMGVNLSAEALLAPAVQDTLLAHADRSIIVELTEHSVVRDYDELSSVTRRLQAAGIHLAIDDAGAGYASFSHVLKLAPEAIKLDLALVRDIDVDPVKQAFVESLAAFAAKVGAFLVAEGIETVAELDALRAAGVELGQGYLFARPGPLPT